MNQFFIMFFCLCMQFAASYKGDHAESTVWGAAVMVIAALRVRRV